MIYAPRAHAEPEARAHASRSAAPRLGTHVCRNPIRTGIGAVVRACVRAYSCNASALGATAKLNWAVGTRVSTLERVALHRTGRRCAERGCVVRAPTFGDAACARGTVYPRARSGFGPLWARS